MDSRRGVTLVEILLVLLLLGTALFPLMTLMSGSRRQTAFNLDRSMAQILATQVLERYRHHEPAYLVAAFATAETGEATIAADPVLAELAAVLTSSPNPRTAGLLRRFRRQATVERLPDQALARFTVRVTWKDTGGGEHDLVCATLQPAPDGGGP